MWSRGNPKTNIVLNALMINVKALFLFLEKEHLLVEGSVGTALASLLKFQEKYKNKNVVIIISGANISIDTLRKVLD